jgi:hypothetical protein
VPRALEKAVRYRLLNEPGEAASICLDVLEADPGNHDARITLLLAMTDQFQDEGAAAVAEAWSTVEGIRDEYERAYYTGVIWERRAKARLHQNVPAALSHAYDWLREAMTWYERAEEIRPAGNDDALLRWNACARLIMGNPRLEPAAEEREEPLLLE